MPHCVFNSVTVASALLVALSPSGNLFVDGAALQIASPDGKELTFNTSQANENQGTININLQINGDIVFGGGTE